MRNLDFEYTSPHQNFDRRKVKGLVASLVALDKMNYNASTALEITAGGRLYNVVVESDPQHAWNDGVYPDSFLSSSRSATLMSPGILMD